VSTSPPRAHAAQGQRRSTAAADPPVRDRSLGRQRPTFVASWIYVLGVAAIAALGVIVLSGAILSLKGPTWWHQSGIGHFFNSIHLWSVELFFLFMVVHLWGKYWMAAWRGGRGLVWATGAIGFLCSIPAALTGYVSQQNFDAQWISTQAKDGLNSIGVGAFFNVTDFGQMYSYHVLLLPLAVVALVVVHVLLVRRHGLVPPFEMQAHLHRSRVTAEASPSSSDASPGMSGVSPPGSGADGAKP
jgi:ubiquinol-cytochrome c reductase cytochrome b subunit